VSLQTLRHTTSHPHLDESLLGRRDRLSAAPWQLLAVADGSVLAMASTVLSPFDAVLYSVLVIALLGASGCYRPRFTAQLGAVIGRLVATVAMATVVVAQLASPERALSIMRLAPLVAFALVGARAIASVGVRTMRARSTGDATLIVGGGAVGSRMAANLLAHPEYGLRPVGIVDDIADEVLPLPILGDTGQLVSVVRAFDVRHVVVAFGRADEGRMVEVLRTCEGLDADVWVVPRLFELGIDVSTTDELWGVPIAHLRRRALRGSQWRVKRAFDICVSGALLLATAPLLLAITLLIKLTSPGPVFFRQVRVGQDGRLVDVLKFRTMTVNDDSDETWNVTSDPRVTRIGRILRPTSLDELPQLLNVLRGDMSLVGPRPERPHFVDLFSGSVPGYAHRHRVPVGLTGLSQVNGLRGDTSIADRATFDNLYIDQWSLWSDLVILARTVWTVIRPPKSVQIDAPKEPLIDLVAAEEAVAYSPATSS
jgi:exopolysaccharide biosynthesis polyprenyl glycosylphosphotransferase